MWEIGGLKAANIFSMAIAILLLIAAYFASTFWWVFAAPLPVLILCQWVALNADVKNAERFFGFTDMVYYLLIGAVVGVGTRYLPELDRVIREDAERTFAQAEAALPNAQEAARQASEARQEASSSLDNVPHEVIGECFALQLSAQIEGSIGIDPQPDMPGLLLPGYPPGCEVTLAVIDVSTRATGQAIAANKRVQDLREVVERGPNATADSSDFFTAEDLEWYLFRLFPALVLCGVMLKVGKTTLSIRKSV